MNWSYGARELIALPRFDADSALSVGRSLVNAGRAEKRLPRALSTTLRKVKQAQEQLARAARDRVPKETGSGDRIKARREENAAWSALQQLLAAWSVIPDAELAAKRDTAKRLTAALFDGQVLARLPHQKAWARAEQRLRLIEERELVPAIGELGGEMFLDSIGRAHKRYGAILGITKVATSRPTKEGPNVRDRLAEFTGVLREYVVQVSAHAELDAGAREVSIRLLSPLAEWQERQPRPRRPEAEPAPAPAEPAPPIAPILVE